jgi:hypothetical protein
MPFTKYTNIVPKFDNSNPTQPQPPTAPPLPDYVPVAQGFVPFANRIILKRDETTLNHPCPDDLAVGELVLNAMTGNLYTKLVSGQVVYYPGTMVCVGKPAPSTFAAVISVPETYPDKIFSSSLFGITLSTNKENELRFNPLTTINQGFPISFSFSYAPSPNTTFTEIARVTIVGDYMDSNFEFILKDSTGFKALVGNFKAGLYNNQSLGLLKIEAA